MQSVLTLLADPKAFNYLIMCLYVVNAVRWAYAGFYGDVWYWISAASITAAVTWGYER